MFPVTAPGKRRIGRGNSFTTLLLPLEMHREYLNLKVGAKKEYCDTFDEAVADDEDDTEEVDPF